MTILNGQGITSYSRTQPIGSEGDLYTTPQQVRAMVNPKLAQISTVSIGTIDTDGDAVTITVTEPDGTLHTYSVTRASAVPLDADAMALALVALVDADAEARGVFTAAASSADVVFTFEHAGLDYAVVATPSAGTTATVATTQAAGGSGIPFGRFVVSGGAAADGGQALALPDGAAIADVLGILALAHAYINQASDLASDDDALLPGEIGPVVREGEVLMLNVGGDALPDGAVFVVVNTAGGDELGQARGDDDGANAIELPTTTAYWVEATASGQIGPVHIRR